MLAPIHLHPVYDCLVLAVHPSICLPASPSLFCLLLSGFTRDYHIGTSTTFGADVDFLVAMTTAKLAFGPAWQNFAIRGVNRNNKSNVELYLRDVIHVDVLGCRNCLSVS